MASPCRHHPDDFAPDQQFCCKTAYWRAEGGLNVAYPYGGRQRFKDRDTKSETESMLRDARANGFDPQPISSRWI